MEHEGSLLCSQDPASGPYVEPDDSNPHLPTIFPITVPFISIVSPIHTINYFNINKSPLARMGEGRGVYRVLVGRPEGKRLLGRPWFMWEDNIKLDLREMGIDGANWTQLA
jgi:hypothetical protein